MGDCLTIGGTPSDERDLPWWVLSTEVKILADREQAAIHGEFVLDGTVILEGSAQLVIEN